MIKRSMYSHTCALRLISRCPSRTTGFASVPFEAKANNSMFASTTSAAPMRLYSNGAQPTTSSQEMESLSREERLRQLVAIYNQFGTPLPERAEKIRKIVNEPEPLHPVDLEEANDIGEEEQALHFIRLFNEFEPKEEQKFVTEYEEEEEVKLQEKASTENERDILHELPGAELHTGLHNGKFYHWSKGDLHKWLPEGISGERAEFPRHFRPRALGSYLHIPGEDRYVLVRDTLQQVLYELDQRREHHFLMGSTPQEIVANNRGIVLGTGKSTAVNLAVYWARKQDWFVVWIPEVEEWLKDGGRITESKLFPDVWDTNDLAVAMAKHLLEVHGDKAEKVPLKVQPEYYSGLDGFEVATDHTNLRELLEYAAKGDNPFATDAIVRFREELNRMTEFPVLIAVDGYDHMYGNSVYYHPRSPEPPRAAIPLKTQQITMGKLFSGHDNHRMMNGTMVCGLSGRGKNLREYIGQFPDEPRSRVPLYSKEETMDMLEYYWQIGTLGAKMPHLFNEYIYSFTGGHPRELARFCGSMLPSAQDIDVIVDNKGIEEEGSFDPQDILDMKPNKFFKDVARKAIAMKQEEAADLLTSREGEGNDSEEGS